MNYNIINKTLLSHTYMYM